MDLGISRDQSSKWHLDRGPSLALGYPGIDYSWVHLDLAAGNGAVYLRRWSDQRNEWIEDTDSARSGKYVLSSLPKDLAKKESITRFLQPQSRIARSPMERQRIVLEGYLNALVRTNTDLDSGGIKQTKV